MDLLSKGVQVSSGGKVVVRALELEVVNIGGLVSQEVDENLGFVKDTNVVFFESHAEGASRGCCVNMIDQSILVIENRVGREHS